MKTFLLLSDLQTHPNLHSPVWVGPSGGHPRREGTNLGVFVPIWLVLRRREAANLGVFDLSFRPYFALPKRGCANSVFGDFPGSSLTVELNSNPEVPRKFPNFPGSSKLPWKFRDFPGGRPLSLGSLTPSPDSQKLSLNNNLGYDGTVSRVLFWMRQTWWVCFFAHTNKSACVSNL